jgi:hypothetical protein
MAKIKSNLFDICSCFISQRNVIHMNQKPKHIQVNVKEKHKSEERVGIGDVVDLEKSQTKRSAPVSHCRPGWAQAQKAQHELQNNHISEILTFKPNQNHAVRARNALPPVRTLRACVKNAACNNSRARETQPRHFKTRDTPFSIHFDDIANLISFKKKLKKFERKKFERKVGLNFNI